MTPPPCLFLSLAQAAARSSGPDPGDTVWRLALLLFVVIALFTVAGVVIYIIRTRADREESTRSDVPRTLAEIRRMRRGGEIDDDEMERLKGIVTAQTRRDLGTPPEPKKENPAKEDPKKEDPKKE